MGNPPRAATSPSTGRRWLSWRWAAGQGEHLRSCMRNRFRLWWSQAERGEGMPVAAVPVGGAPDGNTIYPNASSASPPSGGSPDQARAQAHAIDERHIYKCAYEAGRARERARQAQIAVQLSGSLAECGLPGL